MEILFLITVLLVGVFALNGGVFRQSNRPSRNEHKNEKPVDKNLNGNRPITDVAQNRNYLPDAKSDFALYLKSLGRQESEVNDSDKSVLLAAFKRPFQLKGRKIASITRYEKNGEQTVFEICETDLQSTRAILATKSARYKDTYGDVVTMVADVPPFCVPELPTLKPRKNSEVDIESRSCECGAFTKYRHSFAFNDPRRLCSHLRKFWNNADLLEGDNDLNDEEQEFLVSRMPTGRYLAKAIYVGDYRSIVLFKFEQQYYEQWLDVWAPKKHQKKDGSRNYERFSYALRDGRWSYGAAPHQGPVIASMIETLFRLDDPLLLNQQLPEGHLASQIRRAMYQPEEQLLFSSN